MMRILVTGGFGFVGGRFLDAYGDVLRLRATSRRPHQLAGVEVVRAPWPDADMDALCRDMDAVLHLAAMSEPACNADPATALAVNTLATLRLLEAAKRQGVRRFVYVSTAKVHGNNPVGVIDETTAPRPQGHYAITHHAAEDYVLAAHDRREIEGVVVRLSNAVGRPADPGADCWSLIVNGLCRQAVEEHRVVLRSSGLAWRNFVALGDVVAALRHLLMVPAANLGDGLFNLGGPEATRIIDVTSLVRQRASTMLGHAIDLQSVPPAPGENPPHLDYRIGKLAAAGFRPVTSLADEIDATLRCCANTFRPAR